MMVHVRRQDQVTDHLPETIMAGRFEVVQDLLKTDLSKCVKEDDLPTEPVYR